MATRDFWSRHAWMALLALALILGVFAGVGDITRGLDADPAMTTALSGMTPDEVREASAPLASALDVQIRAGGLHILTMCVLWGVIIVVPFRRRERWAWFTMWTLPLWGASVASSFWFVELAPDSPIPPPAISGWVFFVVGTLALLVSADIARRRSAGADGSAS